MTNSTQLLVREIKQENQDFEWYPTTREIINAVSHHLATREGRDNTSILDIGAGDGRVLDSFKNNNDLNINNLYAIEKSTPLLNAMSDQIIIVGTEFFEQQLLDKEVDVIFCNPPYSEYEIWMEKIISEAYTKFIYLVIPERWKQSKKLLDLISKRNMEYKILDSFDFTKADRQARAKVDVVCIQNKNRWSKNDPFDLFIEENFNNFERKDHTENLKDKLKDQVQNEIINGRSLIEALEILYHQELSKLHNNFNAVRELDSDIFKSLDVNLDTIKEALRTKTANLKKKYWKELFDNLETITDKLCSKQRDDMYSKLQRHNTLDFSAKNAYAVTIWIIKNANKFYDQQLIDMYREMLDPENIKNYKSNDVLIGKKEYRYSKWAFKNETKDVYLKLDYRLINECHDTFGDNSYSFGLVNGLKERPLKFIEDIFTVGKNLGFDIIDSPRRCQEWEAGKARDFAMRTPNGCEIFASIKAFKNGNLHLKFNQDFLKRWNIEAGRLLGWLKDPKNASEEIGLTEEEISEYWKNNCQILPNSINQLLLTDK